MSLARHAASLAKSAVLWTGFTAIALCLVVTALGFLTAAFFIWLTAHFGAAAAAALTAAALLFMALAAMLLGRLILYRIRARTPGLFEDAAGTIAMLTTLAGLFVRQDPKRAILLALLAGAATEYFTARD